MPLLQWQEINHRCPCCLSHKVLAELTVGTPWLVRPERVTCGGCGGTVSVRIENPLAAVATVKWRCEAKPN